MTYFEVNLILNAHSHVNTPAAIKRRLASVLACLRRHGPTEYRIRTHMVIRVEFHRFVARVLAESWDADAIFDISKRIQQDSISVYSPDCKEGAIIGPRADRWGEFKCSSFTRFDRKAAQAERLAAIAARPDPSFDLLMEYALKVFTIENLRALDFRPRDHFFGMLFRRFKAHDHPPTDMEVMGIKELATEHCWNAVFERVSS